MLASAGCGENLTSLDLGCKYLCVFCFSHHGDTVTLLFFTGNLSIPGSNFASAMGLPKVFHSADLQAVHQMWQLRRAQFRFLQKEADKAAAVRQWDEQHEFFFFFFLPFCRVPTSFFILCPCSQLSQTDGREA